MKVRSEEVLDARIAEMAKEYGLDSSCFEELGNYADQVAATAVSNLLSEAKSSGTLETVKKGTGTFADLLGVAGGQGIAYSAFNEVGDASGAKRPKSISEGCFDSQMFKDVEEYINALEIAKGNASEATAKRRKDSLMGIIEN